jgi:hypothetical protein
MPLHGLAATGPFHWKCFLLLRRMPWGEHELLRSVHIPVDHGTDDGLAGFGSKEDMVVAATDRLARGTRELERLKAHCDS